MELALANAPQHATQYADRAARRAAPELLASPLGPRVRRCERAELGGLPYLRVEVDASRDEAEPILQRLGATRGAFELREDGGGVWLAPLRAVGAPVLPLELAEARRYKGKTSEVFTRVLLNLAVFAGAFAERPRLRVVDPLAGGGTTLFVALAAGHDAAGVERTRRDVETTAAFVREFCREARIPHREVRGGKGSRRFTFEVGPRNEPRLLVLAEGDACRADEELRTIPGGARFHALAADLPYGIQHRADPAALLAEALPAWERLLEPGGALAVSWDATRLPRTRLAAVAVGSCDLELVDGPPWDALAHRVDRVIRARDVLVLRRPQ
jgi:hypothetical protein